MKNSIYISSSKIKTLIVEIDLTLVKYFKKLKKKIANKSSIAIVPPTLPHSLGDDAMVNATVGKLREMGYQHVKTINYEPGSHWKKRISTISEEFSFRELNHHKRARAINDIILQCMDVDDCVLIGADVLDGGYGDWHVDTKLDLLRILQAIGIKIHIVGFSYKENASIGSISNFRNLGPDKSIYLRDEESCTRFRSMTGCDAHTTADLAFLFNHSANVSLIDQWYTDQKNSGSTIVGFNPNALLFKYHAAGENAYHDELIRILDLLLESAPNLAIDLLPHDSRSYPDSNISNDIELCEKLYNSVQAKYLNRIRCSPLPSNANHVANIVSHWDAAIAGRMHLGIACLRASVPVIIIEYQGKVKGLMEDHFNLPECIMQIFDLGNTDLAAKRILGLVKENNRLSTHISNRTKRVKALSELSFSKLSRVSQIR